jgi:hypothetical protein
MLIANCLAQTQALMRGKNDAEVRAELHTQGMSEARIAQLLPHKVFSRQPSEQHQPDGSAYAVRRWEH